MKTIMALTLPVVFATACAGTNADKQVNAARQAYNQAASGPAAQYAPDSLALAGNSLTRAEKANSNHDTASRSFAYLAQSRAELADARGRRALAMQERDAERTRVAQAETQLALRAAAECQGQGRQGVTAPQPQSSLQAIADRTEQVNGGTVYVISSGLEFPKNEATLTVQAKNRLDKVADALKSQPASMNVRVEGFTDATGGPAINGPLSQRRAQAVARYLQGRGIPQTVQTQGFGDSNPIGDNNTHTGRVENRRAEVLIRP